MRVLTFIEERYTNNLYPRSFVLRKYTLTVQGDIVYLTYTMILTQRKEKTSLHIFSNSLECDPTLTATAASNKSIMGYMHVVIDLASPSDKI